ncbi:saccharopine dehydrogenase [Candidatus Woesearchaeota archaeon CG10_big_fil_rev_8_21_14_0_10_34_8]|nr:MAG: saccharopine dehydrogenase [Candidatus Woesearchaeota archaeon CG10_big_fil_rev_8_21_14_0_10_34_8]
MNQQRVLILGAGMISGPTIEHLAQRYFVHVVDKNITSLVRTLRQVGDSDNITSHVLGEGEDVVEYARRDLRYFDVVISLLPTDIHGDVAQACVEEGTHLVTASYESDRMRELGDTARQKGIILLNECGLDPGIDHMEAMRMFDEIHRAGGKVVSFESYCGGFPSDSGNNPFGYQFSWSPKGVLLAAKNGARYLQEGEVTEIPAGELFERPSNVKVLGLADQLEGYFNRDSVGYVSVYGLEGEVKTFIRGTLRYAGWCETLSAMNKLGMLNSELDVSGKTLAEALAGVALEDLDSYSIGTKKSVAERLGVSEDHDIIKRLEWLGVFGQEQLPQGVSTKLDAFVNLMQQKMQYEPGQTDMVALQHKVTAEYQHGENRIHTSVLVLYGDPKDYTAMAKTVGLPVAYATELILEGRLNGKSGLVIPTTAEIYAPILEKLESVGIKFQSETN